MMKIKKTLAAFALGSLASSMVFVNFTDATAASQSNSPSVPAMGFVDMGTIEAESVAISDLSDKLDNEQVKFQQRISNKSKDIQKRARDLESKRGILPASTIEDKRKALENEVISLQNETQMHSANMQRARKSALDEVNDVVRAAVKKICKKKNMLIVFPEQVVLYMDRDSFTDVTQDVLKEINATVKTINLQKHLAPDASNLVNKKK